MNRPPLPADTVIEINRLSEPPEPGTVLFLPRRGNLTIEVRYRSGEYCLWGGVSEGGRMPYTVRALGRGTVAEIRLEVVRLAREKW